MDVRELKNILKSSATVVIVENGDPSLVILSYDGYKKLAADKEKEIQIHHAAETLANNKAAELRVENGKFAGALNESELIERLNGEIAALKSQIEAEEKKIFAGEQVA